MGSEMKTSKNIIGSVLILNSIFLGLLILTAWTFLSIFTGNWDPISLLAVYFGYTPLFMILGVLFMILAKNLMYVRC